MKRSDGKCEDGLGHFATEQRPKAKFCVKSANGVIHVHVCGVHRRDRAVSSPGLTARSVAECTEERS